MTVLEIPLSRPACSSPSSFSVPCLIRCPRFISSCCLVACISAATSGSFLFKISRKCSVHLFSCSSYFTYISVLVPHNCRFVGLVACKGLGDVVDGLVSALSAVDCASVTNSSM